MTDDFLTRPAHRSRNAFQPANLNSSRDVQSNNEKTPKSKFIISHATPKLVSSSGSEHNNSSSKTPRFKLSAKSPSFIKTQFSTPKNCTPCTKSIDNSIYNENECSITNPFENHSTIDSLLQPSFSPSVFGSTSNHTFNESTNQSPGSFWNIDQIAIMKPADIDLSKLHEQQNFVKLDPATELKAQKAIDNFFASGINITSPWSSSEHPHYLAIISPAIPSSSSRSNRVNRRRDAVDTPNVGIHQSSPMFKAEDVPHICEKNNSTTVSTQTTLTVPFDVDLSEVLGKYFTYNDNEKDLVESQSNEVLSNSSLRRKLFFQDADDNDDEDDSCFVAMTTTNKKEIKTFSAKLSEDVDAFPMSGDSQETEKHSFITANMHTPSLKSKCSIPKTPSTCQSPFSSSPVAGGRMFDLGTPYRAHCQGVNPNNRLTKIEPLSPCSYSPIDSGGEEHSSAKMAHKGQLFRPDMNFGTTNDMPDVAPFSPPSKNKWGRKHEFHKQLSPTGFQRNDEEHKGHASVCMSPELSPIADICRRSSKPTQ